MTTCEWNALGCTYDARHLLTLSFRAEQVPMCDHCASIFDPDLGARGGYVHTFLGRHKIESVDAPLARQARLTRDEEPGEYAPTPEDDERLIDARMHKVHAMLREHRVVKIPCSEILYRIAMSVSDKIQSTPPIGPGDDIDYTRKDRR